VSYEQLEKEENEEILKRKGSFESDNAMHSVIKDLNPKELNSLFDKSQAMTTKDISAMLTKELNLVAPQESKQLNGKTILYRPRCDFNKVVKHMRLMGDIHDEMFEPMN